MPLDASVSTTGRRRYRGWRDPSFRSQRSNSTAGVPTRRRTTALSDGVVRLFVGREQYKSPTVADQSYPDEPAFAEAVGVTGRNRRSTCPSEVQFRPIAGKGRSIRDLLGGSRGEIQLSERSIGTPLVIAGEDPTLHAIPVRLLEASRAGRRVVPELHEHVAAHPWSLVPEGMAPRQDVGPALGGHVNQIETRIIRPFAKRCTLSGIQLIEIGMAGARGPRKRAEQSQNVVVAIQLQRDAER